MTDVQSESAKADTLPTDEGAAAAPPAPDATPGSAGPEPAVTGGLPSTRATREKTTRVVAARVSVWGRLASAWGSRELFTFLVRKEIKVRYKNSFLGFLWSMLNPALNLAVFYVLFTYFLPNGMRWFVIYLFSAMLVWNLFSSAVLSATSTIVANGGIVKKVAFPREILAFASVGSAFMFFLFQSIVMVGFMFAFWHRPDWSQMWLLIPALVAILLFASALAVFLAAVNVYLRDTQHLVEVVLSAWFWAVPGIYRFTGTVHSKLARHGILWLYFLNPITPVVMTFQKVFYAKESAPSTIAPNPIQQNLATYGAHWYVGADLAVIAVSIVLLIGALVVFGRLEGNFAEEL